MNSSKTHLASLLGSLLFILGAVVFFSVSLLMGVTALGTIFAGKEVPAQQTILLVVSGFEALVLIIAAFVSIQRFLQKPSAEADASVRLSVWQILVSLLIAGIALLIGYFSGKTLNWILLPILTLPAVLLPLLIVFGLGVRGIPLGTRWQSWNVFGIAMTLVPFLLIFLEVFAFIFVLILVVAVIIAQPESVGQLERLSQQMYLLGPQSTQAQKLLAPYMVKPGVIVASLIYLALLVPMMEEVVKPLGVWFFASRLTSPAQGFALGALSGAGYALIETLGVSPQATGWASLLLSRIGTGILHITASALMGAEIVYAVRHRRYLSLLGIYFLSVTMHGVWNALAIFFAFSNIAGYFEIDSPLTGIGPWLNIGMAVLSAIYLVILVLSNRKMRRLLPQPVLEEKVENPATDELI